MKLIQVVVLLTICGTVKTVFPVKAAGYLISAFTFGLDIYGFIDSFDDDKTYTDDSKNKDLEKVLSDKINTSTLSIIAKIDLHGHFKRLLEISAVINTLLIDLRNIIESKTKVARDENIRRFKENFQGNEVILQKITSALTATIPINDLMKPLINVFVETVGCNLTSLQKFTDYYMDLVSSAFAIDLTNERFSVVDLSNQTKKFWTGHVETLVAEFEAKENGCIDRFPQLVKDDLEGVENANDLQRKNALRYSDKLNSVIFVGSDTDSQIKYLEHDDYIFFNTTSAKQKIVFFERKNETIETLGHNSTKGENNYTNAFPTTPDISNLVSKIKERNCGTETIGEMIDDMFFWRSYTLRFWLIMNHEPQNEIAFDRSTRTAYIVECGKDIIIAVEEWKAENASDLVYKTMKMNKATSGVAIVTVPTTLILCLVISYLVEFIS